MSTIDDIIPLSIALAEEESCSRKISNESNTTQSSNGTQYTTCSEQLPYSEHSTTGRTQSESSNPWVPMPDTHGTHDSLGAHNIHGTTPKKISVIGRQQAEYGQYFV